MSNGIVTIPNDIAVMSSDIAAVPSDIATMSSSIATVPCDIVAVPNDLAAMSSDITAVTGDTAAVPNDIVTIPNDFAARSSGLTPMSRAITVVPRATAPEPHGFNRFTIPANTTATVLVPTKSADAITESGKPLAKSPGVKFVRMDGDRAVLEVEAGELSVWNDGEIVTAFRAENDSHSRPWNRAWCFFALASVLRRGIMPREPQMSTTTATMELAQSC